MKLHIKTALDKIHAEEDLIAKTEMHLRNTLNKEKNIEKNVRSGFVMKFTKKRMAIAAISLVFICGLSIGGYAYYKTPVSYVSLDINPSVELGVNAFDTVVTADGYNEDGKTILEGQNVTGTSVTDAVSTLVDPAADNGFIADDGSTIISVTSETNDANEAADLEEAAEKGANEAIEQNGDAAVVYKDNVALTRRDEARKLGITPGKLNLIQKLQKLDPTITVDQFKDAKVKDIMKKVIELKKATKTTVDETTPDADTADQDSEATDKIEKAVAQSVKNQETAATAGNTKKSDTATAATSSAAAKADEKQAAASSKASEKKSEASSKANSNANKDKNTTSPASSTVASTAAISSAADDKTVSSKTNPGTEKKEATASNNATKGNNK